MSLDKHDKFLLETLLPTVVGYAEREGIHANEATLASFMAPGTVLQHLGFTDDHLLAVIKASALTVHDEPGEMQ